MQSHNNEIKASLDAAQLAAQEAQNASLAAGSAAQDAVNFATAAARDSTAARRALDAATLPSPADTRRKKYVDWAQIATKVVTCFALWFAIWQYWDLIAPKLQAEKERDEARVEQRKAEALAKSAGEQVESAKASAAQAEGDAARARDSRDTAMRQREEALKEAQAAKDAAHQSGEQLANSKSELMIAHGEIERATRLSACLRMRIARSRSEIFLRWMADQCTATLTVGHSPAEKLECMVAFYSARGPAIGPLTDEIGTDEYNRALAIQRQRSEEARMKSRIEDAGGSGQLDLALRELSQQAKAMPAERSNERPTGRAYRSLTSVLVDKAISASLDVAFGESSRNLNDCDK